VGSLYPWGILSVTHDRHGMTQARLPFIAVPFLVMAAAGQPGAGLVLLDFEFGLAGLVPRSGRLPRSGLGPGASPLI
jgi:hypothetical protein